MIEEIIKKSNDQFINDELRPFLKIPSNTLNKDGILKAKDFILSYISDFCESIEEIEGEINPLFLARVNGKLKETMLIYMMYDTQPINKKKEWMSDPFRAEICKLPPPLDILGNCIIARGAYNSKTPMLSFLNVIKILKMNNLLPISLLLLIDGEEEKGSPTLLKILEKNKDKFINCIDAFYPSTKQDIDGKAVIKLGYKGILSFNIRIYTKNKEPHSAFSALIPNPASELISLLNLFYSNYNFQINCLKKPYILTPEEKSIMEELVKVINLEKIMKKAGITNIIEDDPEIAIFRYLYESTFNISTLKSGFLKKGSKNYVPNEASCNVDIRFAHDISIGEIIKEIKEIVNSFSKSSKSTVELTLDLGYKGSRVNINSRLIQSLISCLNSLDVETQIWPLSPAAAPLSKINEELGLNFVVGGLGIGGFAHSPNEFIQVDSIIKTRLSFYYFLRKYSEMI
ncbi:MAG: M20/M25/M40 family metallo-hydrolase [Promethearchaeota archaeon]